MVEVVTEVGVDLEKAGKETIEVEEEEEEAEEAEEVEVVVAVAVLLENFQMIKNKQLSSLIKN